MWVAGRAWFLNLLPCAQRRRLCHTGPVRPKGGGRENVGVSLLPLARTALQTHARFRLRWSPRQAPPTDHERRAPPYVPRLPSTLASTALTPSSHRPVRPMSPRRARHLDRYSTPLPFGCSRTVTSGAELLFLQFTPFTLT
ncbi:hypothetical protein HPB50_019587 [Hyalomma asiaticum]|uniref:Uncharacterized protein n=1 Tax=Hyalomma asiaticum TaxID=266040 RepID=A0ACB7TN25_HYAAI|nr:hypothetical protein HPB50_019587 [Hyalomma asiaticum]